MINMNMQKLMMEAQRMQAKLQKEQEELEKTNYEGSSSLVTVVLNGKKEVKSVKINIEEDITKEDVEMLEDMILVAINDAVKKADADKEKRLGKYSQGLTGLMLDVSK